MNKKKIIIKDHPEADYDINNDLLDKLDEIAIKKENEKTNNIKKPLK